MLWFVVPVDPGISWEGHLSGLIVGLIFAFIYKQKIAKPPKFEWEKPDYKEEEDAFMKHFDKNGNFIESPLYPQIEEIDEGESSGEQQRMVYKYFYKKDPEKGRE